MFILYTMTSCVGFPRLLERPGFFLKIPGPGKFWKITLVLESPGKMSLKTVHFYRLKWKSFSSACFACSLLVVLYFSTHVASELYLKVHGHGQTHSRNFCRFKLDI